MATAIAARPARLRAVDPESERAEVRIFRPFFLAGIPTVLTAGCLLGAVALLGIGLRGTFTASAWAPYIRAHANSQLYGWVGFFVIGFALQHHPPRTERAALFHRLGYASLALLTLGIALRFLAEPMLALRAAGDGRNAWLTAGAASAAMQTLAVLLFVANIGLTRHRTGLPMPWQTRFVFAALGWWLVAAAAEPVVFLATHRGDPTARVAFVAEWFVPYREAQFLGFVPMMIFGVALSRLSSDFGFPPARRALAEPGFLLWNAALALRMVGWALYYRSGLTDGSGWLYHGAGMLLAVAAALLVASARVSAAPAAPGPEHRFVRAAFGWLLFAGGMLLWEPLHLALTGATFSHAYTGAIRHAVTVGFISQMILGVALHTVPRLCGRESAAAGTPPLALWAAFWLLNVGNALRVGLETATDYTGRAFLPMGFTGFLELAGLGIWAFVLVRALLAAPSGPERR